MTEEVEVTESEVEFAMQYAEERRQRMDTEVRIHALIHEVVPFLVAVEQLIQAILKRDTDAMAEEMKHLTVWSGNIEANILLNVYAPAGPTLFFPKDFIPRGAAMVDFPQKTMDQIHDVVCAASKSTEDQWDRLAEKFNLLTMDEFRDRNKRDFMDSVTDRMEEAMPGDKDKIVKKIRDFAAATSPELRAKIEADIKQIVEQHGEN